MSVWPIGPPAAGERVKKSPTLDDSANILEILYTS
jgi:hypothetical protein